MKFNIIPLKGEKNSYTKDEVRKNFPAWKNTDFYNKPISENVNTMMITGIHPLYKNLQIVVLDFDGVNHKEVGWEGLAFILHTVRSIDLEPYMIRRTGNGGFHFIYICDTEHIFRNEHRRGLNESAIKMFGGYVGDVDVRANGGLIFWDCKFSDTDEYTTIHTEPELIMTSSHKLHEFVNELRDTEDISYEYAIPVSGRSEIKEGVNVTMYNCEEYGIPVKYYHIFNQLRPAIRDIWLGNYIITKGTNEFRKWGIFWRECLARGFPEYVVLNRLRSGVQPEYDEDDTLAQLKCLKYKNISPKRDYYERVFPEYRR